MAHPGRISTSEMAGNKSVLHALRTAAFRLCLESRHSAYGQIALIPAAKAGISAAQKIPIGGIWGRGPAHQGIE